jgi:hypothetical protein
VGHRGFARGIWIGFALLAAVSFACLGRSDAASPEDPLPDLSGRWVTVQRLFTIAQLPFLGEVTLRTTIGLFSEAIQSGSRLTLQDAYCFTDIDASIGLFVTDISDATMRSIRPDLRIADLWVEEGRVLFGHDWHTEVRGAVLDDPVHDELPDDRSDPRVVDLEGDGRIGFTIPAKIVGLFGGDTYVVQRFRYRLDGELVDPDTILGTVEWSTEQVILWATDALLLMPYTQRVDPDPSVHRFAMRRIGATWTCESIRERVAPLLELLDEVDLSGSP